MEGKEIIVHEGSVNSWINGLFFGALIGAGVALLLTPQSGEKNRQFIGEKTGQIRERATTLMDDTRQRASEVITRARGMVENQIASRQNNHELREENAIMEEGIRKTYDL